MTLNLLLILVFSTNNIIDISDALSRCLVLNLPLPLRLPLLLSLSQFPPQRQTPLIQFHQPDLTTRNPLPQCNRLPQLPLTHIAHRGRLDHSRPRPRHTNGIIENDARKAVVEDHRPVELRGVAAFGERGEGRAVECCPGLLKGGEGVVW